MDTVKSGFLKHRFIPLLRNLPADTKPLWGKMGPQQMIEHFTQAVQMASGRMANTRILTPAENLEKMRIFLMSEKPFRENTPNPLLPDVPPPVRHAAIDDAVTELQGELGYFFSVFEKEGQTSVNPFFGELNAEQNVQLLHKHAVHHLRQFGAAV